MAKLVQIEAGDRRLLAGIDAVMTEGARRSGEWILCQPGCTQCCLGPFAITPLDAIRLRKGLKQLKKRDAERAQHVRERVAAYLAVVAPAYPGDAISGELYDEDNFPAFMDDIACPALDPDSGYCDLYETRPVLCRTFGPATRTGEDTVAACELCYEGATSDQIAQCAVELDPEGLELTLLASLAADGINGNTIVAYALAEENR